MGLAENILANEKVMDKLGKIYADTMFTYYGNGKRGTDRDAKKEMIYYLEQNCGVCRTPSSIASQLSKIWGKIQEEARKYGYRGPIVQPSLKAKSVESGEMNETDEIGETPKYQKLLGMAGARRAINGKDRGSWGEKDAVGGNLPGNTTSDVPIYKHAAQNWKDDPKLRDSFVSGVQKMYKKMTGNKNGVGASGVYENCLHKLSEGQLKTVIRESVIRVLNEMGNCKPYEVNESRLGEGETPFVKLANMVSKNNDIDWKGIYHEVFGENTWARDAFRNALNKYIADGRGYPYECDEYAKKILDILNDYTVINEARLKDIVMEATKKVLKEMDELSPKLLQNAADTAWDRGRYSQAEKFESEAGARASSEFGGDNNIRRITARNIACVSPDGSAWSISRDGSYYFRPKSGYNNESGHLTGMTKFPDYMKTDKHTARTIVKWWQKYNNADAEIPFMNDWHELVKW